NRWNRRTVHIIKSFPDAAWRGALGDYFWRFAFMHALRFGMAVLALAFVVHVEMSAADDKPKYDVSEVMQMAHEGGLLKKVAEGKGNKKDKEDLLEMYVALSKNTPKKGDAKEWKKLTDPIVVSAKEVVKGEKGSEAKLKKAVNCKGCHDKFKE